MATTATVNITVIGKLLAGNLVPDERVIGLRFALADLDRCMVV